MCSLKILLLSIAIVLSSLGPTLSQTQETFGDSSNHQSRIPVVTQSRRQKLINVKPSARTFHLLNDDSSENELLDRSVPSNQYLSGDQMRYYENHPMPHQQQQYQPPSLSPDKVSFTSANNQFPEQGSNGESSSHLSYNPVSQHSTYTYPTGYMNYPYPHYKVGSSDQFDTRQGDIIGGIGATGGGILAGLSGLLGLKGLKASLPFLLTIPFAPLLLPIFVGSLILISIPVIAALLFIPIPVIVIPNPNQTVQGRSGNEADNNNIMDILRTTVNGTDFSLKVLQMKTVLPKMAADIVQGEQKCLERVSCEIGRMSNKFKMDGWVKRMSDKLPQGSNLTKKITSGLVKASEIFNDEKRTGRQQRSVSDGPSKAPFDCEVFACHLKELMKSSMF